MLDTLENIGNVFSSSGQCGEDIRISPTHLYLVASLLRRAGQRPVHLTQITRRHEYSPVNPRAFVCCTRCTALVMGLFFCKKNSLLQTRCNHQPPHQLAADFDYPFLLTMTHQFLLLIICFLAGIASGVLSNGLCTVFEPFEVRPDG